MKVFVLNKLLRQRPSHRMIKLGLSIFDDEKADDEDLPPLDDAAEEVDTNKMEEVD